MPFAAPTLFTIPAPAAEPQAAVAATPLGKAAAGATAALDKAQAKASQKLKTAQDQTPQAFADMLSRWGLPQPTVPSVPTPVPPAQASAASAEAAATGKVKTGSTSPTPTAAATTPAALAAAALAGATPAATGATTSATATAPASGAPATTASAGQPVAATPADSAKDPSLDGGPLWGLQNLLTSGPLQMPAATADFATKATQIETALSRLAPTATPDQLNSWNTALTKMGRQLNQAELAATGVDPQSPPAGWTEPANFAAARSLLNTLQTTVAQAQGLPAPVLQTAAATKAAAGPLTPRFAPIQPQGKATSKLFGATAATTGGGKAPPDTQSQQLATTQAAPPNPSAKPIRPEPPAQAAQASRQASTADDASAAPTLQPDAEPAVTTRQTAQAAKPVTPATVQAAANPAAPQAQAPAPAAGEASSPAAQTLAAAAATTASAPTQASTSDPAKASPAAVAYLSSAIVRQANGKSTSFDIELHPADLGRVDVKLQIQSDGRLAARLAFDNPAAAAQFEARSDDLRRSLEQAGFQVSNNSLSFTNGDQQASGGGSMAWNNASGQGSGQGGGSSASNAQSLAANASDLSGSPLSNRRAIGLDMRI